MKTEVSGEQNRTADSSVPSGEVHPPRQGEAQDSAADFAQTGKEQLVKIKTGATKWRDENGNVYTVEKTTRNGRFVVIRTNPGGNRKAARVVPAVGSAAHVQKKLDEYAATSGWAEVSA